MAKNINVTIPLTSGFTHILLNVAAQGFEYIKFNYSGSGDNGSIDNVIPVPYGCIEIKDNEITEIKPYSENKNELDSELRDFLENKIYDKILENADDWYNNEGGGGTLYICTLDGSYHGNHYYNVIEQVNSVLTGKLRDY
jgi:hypothetical protein